MLHARLLLFLQKFSSSSSHCLVPSNLTQGWLGRASDVRISPMAPSIWSVRPPVCCGAFMMPRILLTFSHTWLQSGRHLEDWEETGHPASVYVCACLGPCLCWVLEQSSKKPFPSQPAPATISSLLQAAASLAAPLCVWILNPFIS